MSVKQVALGDQNEHVGLTDQEKDYLKEIEEYHFIKWLSFPSEYELEDGDYIRVCEANNSEGNVVVIKFISNIDTFLREERFLQNLKGANHVIPLLQSYFIPKLDCMALVFNEYTFGHRPSYIKIKGLTKNYMKYFLEALEYIHSKKIIHCEVEPKNIGCKIEKDNLIELVLADFRFAVDENEIENCTYTGAIGYMPPETVSNEKIFTKAVDIFSAGVIFAELILGKSDLLGKNHLTVQRSHKQMKEDMRQWLTATGLARYKVIDPDAFDLMVQMIQPDPTLRISASAALSHPYFQRKESISMRELALADCPPPTSPVTDEEDLCLAELGSYRFVKWISVPSDEEYEEGIYSRVCMAFNPNGISVVIKLFVDFDAYEKEEKILKELNGLHHTIPLLNSYYVPKCGCMALVFDVYIFGRHFINTDSYTKRYLRYSLEAISYIHEKGIVHCDIKPENIGVKVENELVDLVLADFGSAVYEDDIENCSLKGTVGYMAPEATSRYDSFTKAADIFSIGVIFAELLLGKSLFTDVHSEVRRSHQHMDENMEEWLEVKGIAALKTSSPLAFDLLIKLLQPSPHYRISASDALSHPFFS